jgi:multiple sugar transport system permease protein
MSALGTTSMTDPVAEDRSRTKVPRRRRRPIRLSKVLTSVAIGLVILFPLFPLYWLVISSLKSTHELLQAPPSWFPAHPTISAFKEAFDAVPFAHSFFNSFLYAGTATISVLVTSMMAGYVFSKYHFRGRNVLFWVIVATMFMPPIVTLVPLYWMISRLGLSDSYLGVVLPWLANAFGVFLMRQFIGDLPDELIDAARIDGASELRILWRVVVPLMRPAIVTLGVFSFVYYWNNFLWPLTVLETSSKYPVVLALYQLLSFNMSAQYENVVLAGALVASVPTIIVFLLSQRVFVQGIARVGVKG